MKTPLTGRTWLQSIRCRVRRAIPVPVSNFKTILSAVRNISKSEKHECNFCGSIGYFLPFGDPPRRGVCCAQCGSLERHRLLGLWLAANSGIVDGAKILHFAPEPAMAVLLKGRSSEYRSADLVPDNVDLVLNIENIDLPDNSFDLVVCSHVLEHVDDAKALQEMYRILTPGGCALLMFPVIEGWDETYEDPSHTTPAARETYFGQSDHVRMFGRDVRDRISKAGFNLSEFTAREPNVARYGLHRGEKIFVADKSR